MKTDTYAHNRNTNTLSKERNAGLSWVGTLLSFRAVLLVISALFVLSGCSVLGQDVSPMMKLAQKVQASIEKSDKVEQDFQGIGGDITQIKKDMTVLNETVMTVQNQITNTHNENESLKSLMITGAIIVGCFCILFVALYVVIAKVAPGKTLWNIICPWRMVKK